MRLVGFTLTLAIASAAAAAAAAAQPAQPLHDLLLINGGRVGNELDLPTRSPPQQRRHAIGASMATLDTVASVSHQHVLRPPPPPPPPPAQSLSGELPAIGVPPGWQMDSQVVLNYIDRRTDSVCSSDTACAGYPLAYCDGVCRCREHSVNAGSACIAADAVAADAASCPAAQAYVSELGTCWTGGLAS